jgi:hypothetical protein
MVIAKFGSSSSSDLVSSLGEGDGSTSEIK